MRGSWRGQIAWWTPMKVVSAFKFFGYGISDVSISKFKVSPNHCAPRRPTAILVLSLS